MRFSFFIGAFIFTQLSLAQTKPQGVEFGALIQNADREQALLHSAYLKEVGDSQLILQNESREKYRRKLSWVHPRLTLKKKTRYAQK